MPFRVACAQLAPSKGDLQANLDAIAETTVQAQAEGAELLLLPETVTSGYILEGAVLENAMTAHTLAGALSDRLSGRLNRPIDVCLGFYESAEGNRYNSAAYLELGPGSGGVRGVYRKFFLPTYGVFDEARFVSRGSGLGVFDTRLGRVGVLICEDIWHSVLPMLNAVAGAKMLLVPSASPARGFGGETIGNLDRYRRMLAAIGEEHGIYCLNAQLTGFEGGKGFVGGSMVIDPFGRVAAQAPVAEEHLLVAEVDLDLIAIARSQLPLVSDLQSVWSDIRRIVDGLDPAGSQPRLP
jgi:N-carbamoylputrescine amidase